MKVLRGTVVGCPFGKEIDLESMLLDQIRILRDDRVGEQYQLKLINDTTITKIRVRVTKGDREGQILTSDARINFYGSNTVRLTDIPFTAMDGSILYRDMNLDTEINDRKIKFRVDLTMEDALPLTYALSTKATYKTTR